MGNKSSRAALDNNNGPTTVDRKSYNNIIMGNKSSRAALDNNNGPTTVGRKSPTTVGRKSSINSSTSEKTVDSAASRSSKSKKGNPLDFKWKPSVPLSCSAQAAYNFALFCDTSDVKGCEELFAMEGDFIINNTEGDPLYLRNKDLLAVCFNFWRSFPNCGYGWDNVIDLGDNRAKLVGLRWFGNHTGEPFVFDPYPAIEAKGTYVKDGPLDMICTVDPASGKILSVDSYGTNTGPHGTYNALGGFFVA